VFTKGPAGNNQDFSLVSGRASRVVVLGRA
jgi:hypothetical protein